MSKYSGVFNCMCCSAARNNKCIVPNMAAHVHDEGGDWVEWSGYFRACLPSHLPWTRFCRGTLPLLLATLPDVPCVVLGGPAAQACPISRFQRSLLPCCIHVERGRAYRPEDRAVALQAALACRRVREVCGAGMWQYHVHGGIREMWPPSAVRQACQDVDALLPALLERAAGVIRDEGGAAVPVDCVDMLGDDTVFVRDTHSTTEVQALEFPEHCAAVPPDTWLPVTHATAAARHALRDMHMQCVAAAMQGDTQGLAQWSRTMRRHMLLPSAPVQWMRGRVRLTGVRVHLVTTMLVRDECVLDPARTRTFSVPPHTSFACLKDLLWWIETRRGMLGWMTVLGYDTKAGTQAYGTIVPAGPVHRPATTWSAWWAGAPCPLTHTVQQAFACDGETMLWVDLLWRPAPPARSGVRSWLWG